MAPTLFSGKGNHVWSHGTIVDQYGIELTELQKNAKKIKVLTF